MAPGDWWDDKAAVDNGINPTTDLPWGVYPDKGSPTGYTHTASGTPVYKDGSAWSGTTSDRAINVNVAAPVTWGPSQTDDDGHVTGVPGAVYQINSRGDVSILNKPKPASTTASLWNDTNSDGYDDQSGLPNGVTSVGGKLYFQGKRVNPDGSLYTGTDEAKDAPTWTGYGPKGQGTYRLDGPGGTPGTYIGPTTAAGAGISTSSGGGSSGGGSSGGGSAGGGLTTHAGGYNNTSTSIHEGGYTNTNISEIGPLEAAIRASEFAANNALSRNKAQQDSAALYAQLLSQVDPNAYQAFLETNGGGRLDNALLSGANALSANAINPAAMALEAARGLNQPASAGGGLTNPGAGGGGPVSPGGGLPSAPATTPAAPGAYQDDRAMTLASVAAQGGMRFDTPEEYAAYRAATGTPDQTGPRGGVGGMVSGGYGGGPVGGQMYGNRRQPAFPNVAPVDPRIAAQATDDFGRTLPGGGLQMTTGGGGLTVNGIAAPQVDPTTGQLIGALPPWANTSTIAPQTADGGKVAAYAGGGLARGAAIVGDPQADGRPNPEVIIPHDPNMTYDVVPLQDMNPQMAQRAMGGLPRHAYGDYVQEDVNAVAGPAYAPAWQQAEPVYQPPPQPVYQAPAPAPQPVAPAPAPTQTAQPVNNPAQIGTYSTAPGTAGQPVAAQPAPVAQTPVQQPVAQPATTVPASVVSGASGGSAQPSQAAFDEVMYTRLAATNPWMADPASYMNVDYGTRDPIARRNYEQWLTMRYGVPQESIDFAQARNRLGGASMASMSQGR